MNREQLREFSENPMGARVWPIVIHGHADDDMPAFVEAIAELLGIEDRDRLSAARASHGDIVHRHEVYLDNKDCLISLSDFGTLKSLATVQLRNGSLGCLVAPQPEPFDYDDGGDDGSNYGGPPLRPITFAEAIEIPTDRVPGVYGTVEFGPIAK